MNLKRLPTSNRSGPSGSAWESRVTFVNTDCVTSIYVGRDGDGYTEIVFTLGSERHTVKYQGSIEKAIESLVSQGWFGGTP